MHELLKEEARKISLQYKISQEAALNQLEQQFTKDLKLLKRAEGVQNSKEIARFREYKDFVKKSKKEIYYDLRKFHSSEETEQHLLEQAKNGGNVFNELAKTHVSTNERDPYIADFNKQLVMLAENSKTILDVGGGLFPLTFPFKDFKNLTHYAWLDKDKRAFEILELFSQTIKNVILDLHKEPIGGNLWQSYLPPNQKEFDLVLMVKLVSLIYRQERPLVKYLAEVPAKRILITAAKESLTKKKSIYHRENEILKEFIKLSGRRIVNKLEIANEFGYLLE